MQRTGPQCSQTTQNQLGQKHAPPATSLVSALGSAAGPACAVRRSPLGRKMDRGRRKRERRSSAPPRLCKQLRDNFGGHVLCPGRLGESLSQCAWVIPFLTLEPLRTSPAWKPPGGYEGPGRPHFSLRALQGLAGTPTSALPARPRLSGFLEAASSGLGLSVHVRRGQNSSQESWPEAIFLSPPQTLLWSKAE